MPLKRGWQVKKNRDREQAPLQGIGAAHTRGGSATKGCRVVLADVNADKGRGRAGRTEPTPAANAIFSAPPTSPATASCKQMVDEALKAGLATSDVLINNAAIFSTIQMMKPFWEMSRSRKWDGLMAVNPQGRNGLQARRQCADAPSRRAGPIVNISSAAYMLARPGYAHYMGVQGRSAGLTRRRWRARLGEFGRAAVKRESRQDPVVHENGAGDRHAGNRKESDAQIAVLKRHEGATGKPGRVGAFPRVGRAGFHHRPEIKLRRRDRVLLGEGKPRRHSKPNVVGSLLRPGRPCTCPVFSHGRGVIGEGEFRAVEKPNASSARSVWKEQIGPRRRHRRRVSGASISRTSFGRAVSGLRLRASKPSISMTSAPRAASPSSAVSIFR